MGQPENGLDVVDALVVVVVSSVGRTGGMTVCVVESGGQPAEDPQARSVGQHPPPREAGHERKPVEQVRETL